MKTLEHIFTHSSEQCFVYRFGVFPNLFEAIAGDLVQTTNSIIEESCCIKSTTIDDLNLWVKISTSQTGEFVCNSFTIEEFEDSELRVVMWVSITWDSSRFRVKSIIQTSILLVKCCLEDCLG